MGARRRGKGRVGEGGGLEWPHLDHDGVTDAELDARVGRRELVGGEAALGVGQRQQRSGETGAARARVATAQQQDLWPKVHPATHAQAKIQARGQSQSPLSSSTPNGHSCPRACAGVQAQAGVQT